MDRQQKKIGYWSFVYNNCKMIIGFTVVLLMFVAYWLLVPDSTSQQAIRIVIYSWLILVAGILAGDYIYWRWKIPN